MATVFWERKSVILAEFLGGKKIINTESHCKTRKELRRAIQNRRRNLLISGVCCTKMPDGTPALVHAHYLNSSSREFLSNLHQVITTCFSRSRHFWRPESDEQPREERPTESDEKFDGELLRRGYLRTLPSVVLYPIETDVISFLSYSLVLK